LIRYLKKRILGNSLLRINDRIDNTFSKLDNDVGLLQRWVQHLVDKNSEIQRSHDDHISLTKRDVVKLNKWIAYLHKHNHDLHNHVKKMSESMAALNQTNQEIMQRLVQLEKTGANRTEPEPEPELRLQQSSRFEEKMLLEQIRPNRKNYVIQQIMELVAENKYTTKQAERMIVDEKKLCGRTTFYGHLRELKRDKAIGTAQLGAKMILVDSKHQN